MVCHEVVLRYWSCLLGENGTGGGGDQLLGGLATVQEVKERCFLEVVGPANGFLAL